MLSRSRKPEPVCVCLGPCLATHRRPAAWGRGLVPAGNCSPVIPLPGPQGIPAFTGLFAMYLLVRTVSSHLLSCLSGLQMYVATPASACPGRKQGNDFYCSGKLCFSLGKGWVSSPRRSLEDVCPVSFSKCSQAHCSQRAAGHRNRKGK